MTQEETNELIVKAQNGDKEALEILIEENMGLIITVATEINVRERADDYDGVIKEGIIALIESLKRFDVSLGYKTSTYACYAIRTAMNNYMAGGHASYDPIRITRHYNDLLKNILAFKEDFIKEYCRTPTIDEISKGINKSRREVSKILQIKRGTLSTDYISDVNDTPIIDFVADNNCESEKHIVDRLVLSQCISELKEKERKVIEMKYYQDMTFTNIAEKMGITCNWAKLLEKRALGKLKKMMIGSDYPYATSMDFEKRA